MAHPIPRPLPVIVADNDPATADALGRKLTVIGYLPMVCTDADELARALEAADVAVLFLDLNFDGVDGLAWISELLAWARGSGRALSITAMSAVVGSGVPEKARRAGARSYVSHPVSATDLLSSMARAIRELRVLVGEDDPVEDAWEQNGESTPAHDLTVEDPLRPPSPVPSPEERRAVVASGIPDQLFSHLQIVDIDVILDTVPPLPGVLSLFAPDRHPLYVEWCEDLRARLHDVAEAVSVAREEQPGWFTVLPTVDRHQEGKILDRLVNAWGSRPSLMAEGDLRPGRETQRRRAADPGRVTSYSRSPDSRLVDKLRSIFQKRPNDADTLQWLAFTLYSNGLLDEAIVSYLRLIDMRAESDEHYFYCGNAFFKKGDVKRASQMWRVAAARSPESRIAAKARARLRAVEAGSSASVH